MKCQVRGVLDHPMSSIANTIRTRVLVLVTLSDFLFFWERGFTHIPKNGTKDILVIGYRIGVASKHVCMFQFYVSLVQRHLPWSRKLLAHASRIRAVFNKDASDVKMPTLPCEVQRRRFILVSGSCIRTILEKEA